MKVILLPLLLLSNLNFSQNLISNPSFEEFRFLPTNSCQSSCIKNWTSSKKNSAVVTYFNAHNGKGYLPTKSEGGEQIAYEGTGFIGLGFGLKNKYKNKTQYIYTKLPQSLIKNHTYKITAYVSLANVCRYSVNNIQCCFANSEEVSFTPIKLINEADGFLNSSKNWMKIENTYTANGNENYFVLGGTDYSQIAKTKFKFHLLHLLNVKLTYYFIDNISLIDVTESSSNLITKNSDSILKKTISLPKNSTLNVYYLNNEVLLKNKGISKLDSLIDTFKNNLYTDIKIYGYSSYAGTIEKNINLSIQRAKNVYEYLMNKTKHLNLNIEYEGNGISMDTNENSNRRVEIKITCKVNNSFSTALENGQ